MVQLLHFLSYYESAVLVYSLYLHCLESNTDLNYLQYLCLAKTDFWKDLWILITCIFQYVIAFEWEIQYFIFILFLLTMNYLDLKNIRYFCTFFFKISVHFAASLKDYTPFYYSRLLPVYICVMRHFPLHKSGFFGALIHMCLGRIETHIR
jgi:hypothetical protein